MMRLHSGRSRDCGICVASVLFFCLFVLMARYHPASRRARSRVGLSVGFFVDLYCVLYTVSFSLHGEESVIWNLSWLFIVYFVRSFLLC